jgi:hypothetical protein
VHLKIVQNATSDFEVNKKNLPAAPTGVLQKKFPQLIWLLSKVAAVR